MPAGTWNLGRLRKHVEYVGLKDLGISIVDTTTSADRYFNVVEFPTTLTGGKNLFKLKANANRLVRNSKLHIEVLDSNGKPIYYEPINYIEQDGTRVIAIYIYPDTPYGTATVYLAGRARLDQNNRSLRYSQDVNDRDYLNFPNVIWSRTVSLAPESLNSTEIIFTKKPILNLSEIVQPYLQPVNLENVATQSMGIGTYTITPKPTSISTTAVPNMAQLSAKSAGTPAVQGAFASNSPPSWYGTAVMAANSSMQMAVGKFSNQVAITSTVISAADESIFQTSIPFFTTNMTQGDVITINNPLITTDELGASLDSSGFLLPKSQDNADGDSAASQNQQYALSGSYHFIINQVLTTKKAYIVLVDDPAGFKNVADANTGGKWQVQLGSTNGGQIIEGVDTSTNYTCSFTLPFVLSTTEQSQSFAEIKIADIEPATGDVYKLKTFYKAGGAFGNFTDAGETILEQIELLEDTGSYEGGAQDGAQYNRTGFFSSLEDYQLYWTSSQGGIAPTNAIEETFEPDDLMSGIRLQPAGNYGTNDFSYIKIKDEHRPTLTRNTQYILTINSFADLSTISTDPNVVNKPQLDIYVSASAGTIQADNLTVDAYLSTPPNTYENSLQGNFADGGPFGVRVGSIQLNASASLTPGIFRFNSSENVEPADLYLVQRNGRFNVGNISLKTFNESKFTPNFTRINTRIPTQFLQTPLTFKIIFYDYLGRPAETEALIYPVVFTGENVVIGGNNNLLSGSVFIGNAVGSGIELAGVNSGFIRSIGYEGFKSASRTDTPGGFMLYTGSVLPNAPDAYDGTGLEIVEDSGSYFRFSTGKDAGIDIRTPKFYLGDDTTSISGSNGNILISGSSVSIETPTFFFGNEASQISGSNGNIKISGSKLDMRTETFYLGGQNAFVSGANGNIEISSSDFHLNNQGQVVMQGTITATAGGTIGGWTIGTSSLSAGNSASAGYAEIDASNSNLFFGQKGNLVDPNDGVYLGTDGIAVGPTEALIIKASGQITGSFVKFDGGNIAGWKIDTDKLLGGSLEINKAGYIKVGDQWKIDDQTDVDLPGGFISSSQFKVSADGKVSGSQVFFTGGTVGGFSLDATKITGTNIVIDSAGSLQTSDYASDLKGWKLSAAANGFLEVENAKIRGTLSTAVFEKETVNAVGGQLYVANSTTLTSSSLHTSENYTKTDTTMSVVNVSGFSVGEILSAKKVSPTGFGTEYMRVVSASRNDASSESDLSGNLFVLRGYSGSIGGVTSSLGDIAGLAQTYSGSQVLVSTGKVGTGFIRLNANPNDQATPYMDIVERTGSAIYDVQLKARLGDLSGLANSSYVFGESNPGFGLATDNVFLQGGIIARTGSIGGVKMHAGKLFTGEGEQSSSNTPFYLDDTGRFSLKDKLKWDGTNLIIKGQLQLSDGTDVGNGMQWTGSWDATNNYTINNAVFHNGASYIATAAGIDHEPPNSSYWDSLAESGSDGIIGSNAETLILTADSNVFAFASASSNVALDPSILISVSTQNLVNAINDTNITVTGADTTSITGLAFSSASNGTGIISASLSFTAGTAAGGLNSDKDKLPLTITATSASLSDTTTIHKIVGGTGGINGTPGDNGADAQVISLGASTLVFVKDLAGTITPATASLTASLQNMLPATASYTTTPVVTLNTGSQAGFANLTHMELTKDHFGTNTSVKVTAASGSNHSDSVTFVLLDEGSGNVQAILGNSVHTFQAASDQTVDDLYGGGTTLQVYEGATALTYEKDAGDIQAGEFSASINVVNITPGVFGADGATIATLNIPSAMSATAASGAIHFTITGSTQNGTPFELFTTQSFAKSIAGAVGGSGSNAKAVIVNGSTLIFTKDIAGVITPETASFTASLSNATDDGEWSTTTGTITGPNSGAVLNTFTGPPKCIVTRDNFVDGMEVTYKMASDDFDFADTVTLKLLDAGSGNIQAVLGNAAHTFQADHTGSVTDFSGGNTSLQVFEGATPLTYTESFHTPAGFYSASVVPNNMTPGVLVGDGLSATVFALPTAIIANTAELRIQVSGSTQNGTSFLLPTTQSFAKSLAGSEPITPILTNEVHTFVGDLTGTPVGFAGSGTTIAVFEGISPLQGTVSAPAAGQFKVSGSGDNIQTGSNTVSGTDIVVSDLSDATETSGSVKYTMIGKTLGGTPFTQSKSQTWSTSTQASSAKSLILTTDSNVYAFASASSNVALDPTILISVSTQNLADTIDNTDITVTGAPAGGSTSITGLAFSSASSGTGVISASLSFSAATNAGGLNSDKDHLPLTISTEIDSLSDSTTIHRIEGGTAGDHAKTVQLTAADYVIVYAADGTTPDPASSITLTATSQNFTNAFFKFTGDGITDEGSYIDGTGTNSDTFSFSVPSNHFSTPKTIRVGASEGDQSEVSFDTLTISAIKPGLQGDAGTPAKLLSLEASSLVFVKALDGTITPATASITASLQNTTSATASYTTTPTVTLNTGSQANFRTLTHMELTKDHFGTNSSVRVNVSGDSGAVSDSMTFVLLDEGSGNVQAILGNSSHTVPADATGNNETFTGGGTTLNVYEGATALTYDSGSQSAGEFSASITTTNITPGIFDGDDTTTAVLSAPSAMSSTNGAIHFTIQGLTQNNTSFTSSLTQSFAKSLGGVAGINAKSLVLTTDSNTFAFASASSNTAIDDSIRFIINAQNLDSATDTNSIVIKDSGGTTISNPALSSSISNGSGLVTGSLTFSSTLGGDAAAKLKLPITVTVTEDGLSDSTTIHKIEGGTGGTNAKLVSLAAQSSIFTKALDGTITPSSIGFTASLQNTADSNATFTTLPSITITAGVDDNHKSITSTQFGTNSTILVTATEDGLSDSFTIALLDEGSGNVQAILGNPAHIFQAASDQTVTGFDGGGTSLNVYEGATPLIFETTAADVSAGEFSASISGINITPGTFTGDTAATAILSAPTVMSNTSASGSIHFSITGSTQNGTPFFLPLTQSFAKSVAGTAGVDAKTVVVSSDTAFFVKAIDGTYSPATASISGSGQNLTTNGIFASSSGIGINHQYNGNENSVKITSANFVDGMKITFTADSSDGSVSDSVTLKELDAGSGNTQVILGNLVHTFQADHTGSVTDFSGGGTSFQVFEGATPLTYTESFHLPAGHYSASFVPHHISASSITGDNTTTGLFGEPTVITANAAELRISISGSTQNGTSFILPVTQSFVKSLAGAEPITMTQTNQSVTLVGDTAGVPTGYAGSGNVISAFEGIAQLQAVPLIGGVITPGTFKVAVVVPYNITIGTEQIVAKDVKYLDSINATETSGSLNYIISGQTLGGTLISRVLTQNFTVTTKPNDSLLLSAEASTLVFVKALDGTITPATASITASLQNTTSATASYTTTPVVTLNTGSQANFRTLTHMELTKDHFGTNSSVRVNVSGDSGAVSDSMTFVLLDEGSGNILATLGNSSHTVPADNDGSNPSFTGGGTTLNVYEGATELQYEKTSADIEAGQFSASLQNVNMTPGTFSGDETTTATLSVPTEMSQNNGAIHFTIQGLTQNNTSFTSSLTQSFAKSLQGGAGANAKTINLTSEAQVFLTTQAGTVSPDTIKLSVSKQNTSATINWTTSPSTNLYEATTGGSPITTGDVIYIRKTDFQGNDSVTITATATADSIADSVTILKLDEGSGNVQLILGNQSHTFQANHTGSVTDFSGGGTSFQVFEGATLLNYNATLFDASAVNAYTASVVPHNITPGALSGDPSQIGTFAIPTAISADAAELRISISGSTQNGTPFELFATQSFVKSLAGSEPITVVQTNPAHTFVGGTDGLPTSEVGSGNKIHVFEGASELLGVLGTPNAGEFKVVSSGDNITPGNSSNATPDYIEISDSDNVLETSGSITYAIAGKTLGGTVFNRTATQVFTSTTEALDAKVVTVTPDQYFFIKDIAGNYTPDIITISGSAQNLTGNATDGVNGWEATAGILSDQTTNTNENHCKVTSADFVDGMKITFTANSADDNITDSVTLTELDAGSGNTQVILGNSAHTFQADYTGDVPDFTGGGTSIRVFEGVKELPHISALQKSVAGPTSVFYNATASYSQSMGFGSEYPSGSAGQGYYSSSITPVNVTPGALNATIGNTFRMQKYNKFTNDPGEWHLSFADQGSGGFTNNDYNCGDNNDILTGWHQALSIVHQSNDIDGILSEAECTAIHDAVEIGDKLLVWRHPKAWFEYTITDIDTNNVQFSNGPRVHYGISLANSSSESGTYNYAVTRGAGVNADASCTISYYKPGESTQALLSIPTAMSAASGAIHISITGSTQNGTPFELFTTQSFAKSIGGTEPIVVTQDNQQHILIGDTDGNPESYIGSGNKISVFEGGVQISGSATAVPSVGQFKVSASADNIQTGSMTDSQGSVFFGDLSDASTTSTSGSISYQITGRTLANVEFTRSLSQAITTTTAASDAKLVTLSSTGQVFIKSTAGTISPARLGFTSSLQNTIDNNALFTSTPSVTFTNGTGGTATYNANRKSIVNTEMTVGVPVVVTATSDSDGLSDSMTIHLLDEGSGTILPVLGNSNHTFQGLGDGTVPDFFGGGTSLQVYEGATALTFKTNSTYQGDPGIYSASLTAINVTPGTFGGGPTTTAELSIPTAMSLTAASGSITFTITGQTQNGTDFTQSLIQSLVKSVQGVDGAPGATGPNFSFLSGSLESVDTENGLDAGLLMTSKVFGFHGDIAQGSGPPYNNAQLSDFTSYLDHSGSFYLGKGSSAAYFAWNNLTGEESLLISGSEANITVDKFFLGGGNQFISGSTGNIEISSSFFHLTADGTIKARAGEIGGFGLTENAISSSDNNIILRANGQVTASNILIDSGSFGVIESGNWGSGQGSQLDLNGSELTFGGYACPTFHVSASGAVTHGGLTERIIDIGTGNYTEYYENGTADGSNSHTFVVLDGSQGGCVTSTVIISRPPDHPIGGIKTLASGGEAMSRCTLMISASGVQYDDSVVSNSTKSFLGV